MPSESVHCAVTSPPYWGLRDYGHEGQFGLESTPDEYVQRMVEVFREVRRVLRTDGTLWLNLGDTYSGNRSYQVPDSKHRDVGNSRGMTVSRRRDDAMIPRSDFLASGCKPKDLVGIPWRVAFALQADGWYLRSDIIWHKPNPMPESVTDRPTKAHEYLFLLTKSARYYYDAEAIKEDAAESTKERAHLGVCELAPGDKERVRLGIHGETRTLKDYSRPNRNKRSVWTIATQPFPGAHFAVFPPTLIEPCILAGTSEKGCCSKCGAPMERQTETEYRRVENRFGSAHEAAGRNSRGKAGTAYNEPVSTRTTGWRPTCDCDAGVVPCVVLDPFGGSGTTGMVAAKKGRDSILCELNPEYGEMAGDRIMSDAPMFNTVELLDARIAA
jgi:DNA modification methylase